MYLNYLVNKNFWRVPMRKQSNIGLSNGKGRISVGRMRRMARLMLAVGPVAGAVFGFARHAAAQTTYTWDPTFANASGCSDGTGTWDTSTTSWFNGSTDTAWVNGATSFAVIGDNGAAGTITLGTSITAGSIQFNATGSGDYLITGGNLTAALINVNYSGSTGTFNGPTIASSLGGTSGETFSFAAGTAGTVNLAGSNTYTGATTINNSTVVVQAGGNLGAATNALFLGATAASTVGNLSLNASVNVGGITIATSTTNVNQILIATGATLTSATGGVEIGGASSSAQYATNVAVSGGGTWSVTGTGTGGNFGVSDVGSDNNSASQSDTTLNMSGLANFSYTNTTGTFGIGWLVTRPNATATLANSSSTITALTIGIGDSANPGTSANNAGGGAVLNLGAGTNTLNASTIDLGFSKGDGSIQFLGTAGSVVIAGTTGGTSTANLTLGDQSSGSGSSNPSNLLLAGHMANVQLGTLTLQENGNSTGASNGTLTFDTGTFNVANLLMADHVSGTGSSNTQFTLGGSTANTTATGVLTVTGTFALADQATTSGSSTGVFTINGGTANIETNIIDIGTANVNGTINLNAGTLDMNGFAIGTTTVPVTAVNLLSNGGTATLESLGGIGISTNGTPNNSTGGLNMNGSGTLLMAGVNNYTGTTYLSNGILQLTTSAGLPNSTVNANGGQLGFSAGVGTFTVGSLSGNSGQITLNDTNGNGVNLTVGALSGTFGAQLSGLGGLTMSGINGTAGATVQYITGSNNNYSGNTIINGGTLQLENGGQLYNGVSSPGTVTISGGTLAGQGTVNSSVTLNSGAINPDTSGQLVVNTLHVAGGTLDFTLNGSSIGQIDVNGLASLSSGALQFFAPIGSAPAEGTYTIISAGSLTGGLSLADQVIRGTTFQPEIVGNDLELIITGGPSNLVWIGSNNNGAWDINTTANWNNQTTQVDPSIFKQFDNVTFDDSASKFNVNINGQVQPSTVTFSNNNNNYVLASSTGGGITGVTGLNFNGSATVTIQTVNTYTGDTDVNNGTLILNSGGSVNGTNAYIGNNGNAALTVGSGGTLASTNIALNNNGTLTIAAGGSLNSAASILDDGLVNFASSTTINSLNSAGTFQNNNQINGNGTVVLSGSNSTLTITAGGSFTGVIVDNGSHSGLAVSGGTLTLAGSNTYSGGTTIASGAVLQIDDGGSNGSINPASAVTDNGALIFDRNDNPTIANNISGIGSVQQSGNGTITFSGSNSYTGGTDINTGSVQVNPGGNIGAATGAVVLGIPQNPAGTTISSSTGNLIVNTNLAIGSLSATTDSGNANILDIAQGVTLTDNGGFIVGAINNTTNATVFNSALTATGGGSLVVTGAGNFLVGQPSNNSGGKQLSTVDMSGLNSIIVNTTGTFGVGLGANSRGLLNLADTTVGTLAPVNVINASDIEIGNSQANNNAGVSVLTLGSGSNTLEADTIDIGLGKTGGTVAFSTDSTSSSTITITGTGGVGVANINVSQANGGTFGGIASALELAGFQANVQAGSLIIGANTANSADGALGMVNFDTGTFSAQSVIIGADTGGTSTTGPQGTLTIGNANNTATGVFTVGTSTTPGTFILGENTNTGVNVTVTANVTFSAGTVNSYANIVSASTTGSTDALLTLTGSAVLNMEGYAIGNTGPAITLSLAPNGSDSVTLENLGGSGINSAGLDMNGSGTLILSGSNTYTGGTSISGGVIQLGSSKALPASGTLTTNGGTVDLAGNSPTILALAGSGGEITNNSSSSAATLTIDGSTSSTFGGSFVDGSSDEPLNVTYSGAGTLTLSGNSNSSSGVFKVTSGDVLVIGSLASNGNVQVTGGSLGGTGNVGNVTASGGSISPGINSSGNLNVNSLAVSGSAALDYTISGGSSTEINDNGNASFSGGSVLVLPLGSLNSGSYTLLSSQNLTGSPSFTSLFVRGETASFSAQNNSITLNVTGSQNSANLTWVGSSNSGAWDTHTTENWKNNGSADYFYWLDNVTFDNTASNFSVNVTGLLDPGSVTINGSHAYTFSGTGSIAGATSINDNDTGLVIFDTNNSFTGGVNVNSGPVQLGQSSDTASSQPLGTGNVLNDSTVTFASSQTVTVPGAISGSGSVAVSSGVAILGNDNTYSGGTTVNGGTLEVSGSGGATGLGSGNVTVNAGGTLIGASQDAFGYGGTEPSLLTINGGTVTDLGASSYRVSLPNITFGGATGGTIGHAAANTGDGDGNYSFNGFDGPETLTVNLTNSAATALISATIGVEQPTQINLESGNLLITGGLLAYGTEPVTVNGTGGQLTLDGNSTFPGSLTINATTVQVGASTDTAGLNSPLGEGTVANNGTIVFASSQSAAVSNIVSGTGSMIINSGTVSLTGNNTFTGGVTLNHGTLQVNGTGGLSGLGEGNATFGAGTTVIGLAGDAFGYDTTAAPDEAPQTININGATVTDAVGAYRLTLPNVSFTGGTLTNVATNTGDPNGQYSIEGIAADATATVTVNAAPTTALINATTLSFESTTTFNVAPGVSTTSPGTPDLLVTSQLISYGTFGLGMVKTGSGVMQITGSNTYTGGTSITGGTLLVDNTAGSGTGTGPVAVAAGGALGGTGSISGNVSVASGGALSLVGGSPLTLAGSLTLAAGSDVNFSAASVANAGLISTLSSGISGIADSSTVNVTVPSPFTGTETFDVLNYVGADPFGDFEMGTYPAGYTAQLVDNTSGDQIDLSLTAGPASLVWNNGNVGDGVHWDTTSENWNNGTSLYTDGSAVVFNDANNGHYAVTLNGTVSPGSVTFGNNTGNYTLSGTGGIAGATALTLSGTGTVTISTTNSYSGGTNVNSGKLVVASAGALPADHALSIGTAGAVALSTTGGGLVVGGTGSAGGFSLSSLSMSTGSSLDLGSNAVTIHYGGTDPVSQIASYLATGFNSGGIHGWGGKVGIVSSTVASLNLSQSALIYSVGYADGADGINPAIPSGEIEIMPTLAGDAKMQGNVVFGDFQLLSQYFGDAGTSWDEGDFTYNGTTNFGDFQLLSQNFGASSASLTSGELAAINSFAAQFGDTMQSNGTLVSNAAVPEPATMGMLAVAGFGLLSRRRRRNR
jgi:fibronectin-binding autotransporter adhesin